MKRIFSGACGMAASMVFLLPGESKIEERKELINRNLSAMCSEASQLRSGVWRLTPHGLNPYEAPATKKKRAQRPRIADCESPGKSVDTVVEKIQALEE